MLWVIVAFWGVSAIAQDLFLAASKPADSTDLTSYVLGGNAVCINGCPAQVQAAVRDESLWVITIGSISAGTGWCISELACAWEAKQGLGPDGKCPPAVPAATAKLNPGGLQNPDCNENPDFCGASHGVISMCDQGLLIGDGTTEANGTTLHFRGQSIVSESLKKLASLGMSKATHVLVTGFVWGGTATFLTADSIGNMLKTLVPGLQVYKAVPVDGVHPNFITMMCTVDIMAQNCNGKVDKTQCQQVGRLGAKCPVIPDLNTHVPTWVAQSQDTLFKLTSQAGTVTLPEGCQGSKCLWFNESAPHVSTDMFVVQGMPGVWDLHCNFEANGPGVGAFPNMVSCSAHGNYFFLQYQCAQYPFHCNEDLVRYWEVPLQHKYLADITASGHAGFVHSCFLGAYWNSPPFPNNVLKKNTTWWNQIQIDNTTMRDAFTAWWKGVGANPKKLYKDCVWNPDGQAPSIPAPGPGTGDRGIPWYTSRYNCNPTCWGNPCY